jgi:hypothetical protein
MLDENQVYIRLHELKKTRFYAKKVSRLGLPQGYRTRTDYIRTRYSLPTDAGVFNSVRVG